MNKTIGALETGITSAIDTASQNGETVASTLVRALDKFKNSQEIMRCLDAPAAVRHRIQSNRLLPTASTLMVKYLLPMLRILKRGYTKRYRDTILSNSAQKQAE